jgi:phosphoribosyl 1,2-cyclic phosphodiesterase
VRFASLGSGSEGNSLLAETRDGVSTTRVLLDCGFSLKETERRLARLEMAAADLDAILITHEHADHIGGALTLARKFGLPIFMSWGTAQAVGADTCGVDLRVLWGDETVCIGDFEVTPYTVPHDAREPLQFVFSDGRVRLGILTDAGSATSRITAALSGCEGLVLECNHDRRMLAQSRYPASLKARIGGSHGHLANDTAAQILAALDRSRLKRVVAAHLSLQNNLAELAQEALAGVLGAAAVEVTVATQQDGFAWLAL